MKGWIMDGIAKEAADSIPLINSRIYLPTRLIHRINPSRMVDYLRLVHSRDILFMHFRSFFQFHRRVPASNSRVFITHLDAENLFDAKDIIILNKAKRLIFQNKSIHDYAISIGVNPKICLIGHGAVSNEIFFPSVTPPKERFILISGEYKPRKNPELLRSVVSANSEISFVLHGDGWESFFGVRVPRNLRLISFNKSQHPSLVRDATLLLSLSRNEGGPFPVMEALASGTPVVCTNTGFANEIVSEESGIVLANTPTVHEVTRAIHAGSQLKKMNWSRSLLPAGHDWETFGRTLYLL